MVAFHVGGTDRLRRGDRRAWRRGCQSRAAAVLPEQRYGDVGVLGLRVLLRRRLAADLGDIPAPSACDRRPGFTRESCAGEPGLCVAVVWITHKWLTCNFFRLFSA